VGAIFNSGNFMGERAVSIKIVVGLGNPGEEYRQTRHNVGQMFLDFLIQKWGLKWKKRKDLLAEIVRKDSLWLVKPQIFMNESGKTVRKIVDKLSVDSKELYVIHDELDLPLGEWKLTFAKSSPLHKGILSVEQHLKTKDFWRLRVGVDNRELEKRIPGEKYVLERFGSREKESLKRVFKEIYQHRFPGFPS